jgi:hypothetical protein
MAQGVLSMNRRNTDRIQAAIDVEEKNLKKLAGSHECSKDALLNDISEFETNVRVRVVNILLTQEELSSALVDARNARKRYKQAG